MFLLIPIMKVDDVVTMTIRGNRRAKFKKLSLSILSVLSPTILYSRLQNHSHADWSHHKQMAFILSWAWHHSAFVSFLSHLFSACSNLHHTSSRPSIPLLFSNGTEKPHLPQDQRCTLSFVNGSPEHNIEHSETYTSSCAR